MSREARKPGDYKYIAAWGGYLGSHYYYIKAEQEKAAVDHAPVDAIYKQYDGTWLCRSGLGDRKRTLAKVLDRRVAEMEQGQ